MNQSTLPAMILADLDSQPDDEARVQRALELMQDIADALEHCDDWPAVQDAVSDLRATLRAEAQWRAEAEAEHEHYMRTSSRYRCAYQASEL